MKPKQTLNQAFFDNLKQALNKTLVKASEFDEALKKCSRQTKTILDQKLTEAQK